VADDTGQQYWHQWLADHGAKLLVFAQQQARNESDAEDILQEALVRAWKPAREHSHSPPDLPLVFKKIRETAIDFARKDIRRNSHEGEAYRSVVGTSGSANPLDEREINEVAMAALRKLPREQREIVVLKIWGGQTFREIAVALGIPQNTAASRYRYALKALGQALAKNQNEDSLLRTK
jgi:RNA polymerase sigma-70 factor (ECF subfamily)